MLCPENYGKMCCIKKNMSNGRYRKSESNEVMEKYMPGHSQYSGTQQKQEKKQEKK